MGDSFSKKEQIKKKLEKQKAKAMRREERKTDNDKGKDVSDMFMYVDEYGRLTKTPPEKSTEEISLDDIQLGAAPLERASNILKGTITYFSEKGYGFISEHTTDENIFCHQNQCEQPLKKGMKVSFEKERTPKGYSAINITIIK